MRNGRMTKRWFYDEGVEGRKLRDVGGKVVKS